MNNSTTTEPLTASRDGISLVLDYNTGDAYVDVQPGASVYRLLRVRALALNLGYDFFDPRELDPEELEDGAERVWLERV